MPAADVFERVDLRHGAAHVHDQDGLRFWGDGLLHRLRIQAQRLVDLRKDGDGAREQDSFQIGDEGKRGKDDFVARSDAAGRQCRAEGCGAARADMGIAGSKPRRQSLFEFAAFPLAVSGPVEAVAHQHARVEHFLNLPSFVFPDQFKSRHRVPLLQCSSRLRFFDK